MYYVLLKYQPRNYLWNKGQDIIEREKRGIRQERETDEEERKRERWWKIKKSKNSTIIVIGLTCSETSTSVFC